MSTTTKRIASISAAAALFLLAVWYVILFRPESNHLALAHRQHAAAEQQISQLTGKVQQLKVLQAEIPSDQKAFVIYSAQVPDNPDLAGAITAIHQQELATGVTVGSVNPTPASTGGGGGATGGGVPAISTQITATGTYPQVTAFLRGLATMPRVLVVDHAALTSGGQSHELSLNISARVFYAGQPTP